MLSRPRPVRIMNKLALCQRALPSVLLLALLVCGHSQRTSAELGGSSLGASGSLGKSEGLGIGGQASAGASLGGGSGSSGAQAHMSGSLGGSGVLSASAQAHIGGSGSGGSGLLGGGGGGESGGASGSASLSTGPSTGSAQSYGMSTARPEGLFSKLKEVVKGGVDNLVKDDKGPKGEQHQERERQLSSGGASMSGSLSLGGGGSGGGGGVETGGGQKSEGLIDKLGDSLKKGREVVKETAKEVKADVKSLLKPGDDSNSSHAGASGSLKLGGFEAHAKVGVSGSGSSSGSSSSSSSASISSSGSSSGSGSGSGSGQNQGPLAKLVNKGQEMVHKIENKASEVSEKLSSRSSSSNQEGMEVKSSAQMSTSSSSSSISSGNSGSGSNGSGGFSASASFNSGGGSSGGLGSSSGSGRSGGQRSQERGLAVEIMDRAHEVVRAPVEQALEPIDKALGIKKDPLVKVLDTTEEILRQPLNAVAKPVESVLSGAFKTTDEAKAELSAQERRRVRLREERARKEGRTVLGQISDRSIEFVEKPWEIILKPVDRALGFDKEGRKNPLIQLIDEIYELSKKPLDALARPIENILRRMATGEQDYQVSVRFKDRDSDPKLVTRVADGALNIADRLLTKPIELAMRPLGYDQKKKNPVVDAAHSLKNATKVGLELLTRPIDRIIKEIAEIGAIKNEAQREAEIERKRQEASRIVSALDKFHEMLQQPFEIVLKPLGQVMGYNKDGKKEPLLRAWDVGYQVFRAPIQVISRPIEDVILGERRRSNASAKGSPRSGNNRANTTQATTSAAQGAQGERRKNFFVDSIKRMEKFAVRPLDVITSPIRRLILGEDTKPSGNVNENGNGGGVQAQAKVGQGRAEASSRVQKNGSGRKANHPDKIVQTIEKINNVVLKPVEVMTQPFSDMVTTSDGKSSGQGKSDAKFHASVQVKNRDQQQQGSSRGSSLGGSNSGSQVTSSGPPKSSSLIAGFGSGTPQAPTALSG